MSETVNATEAKKIPNQKKLGFDPDALRAEVLPPSVRSGCGGR